MACEPPPARQIKMTTEAPHTDQDDNDSSASIGRPLNREWLKLRAKSFSVRWAAVSVVLWLTAWNKAGYLLSGTPLIVAAIVSSCAAIGFYITHHTMNK